jgi:hypothetical protein
MALFCYIYNHMIVAYHGTDTKFNNFDDAKIGSRTDPGFFGAGHYFVSDKSNAGRWGTYVVSAELTLKHPLHVNGITDFVNKTGQQQVGSDKLKYRQEINRVTNELKRNGYDGVIYSRSDGTIQYIVFSSKDIKVINVEPASEKTSINEGAILIDPADKAAISKYLNAMNKYAISLFKYVGDDGYERSDFIESEKLTDLLQTKSLELSDNFSFRILYYFKVKTAIKGRYDKDNNCIMINLALHSDFNIWRSGFDRRFNIISINFKTLGVTFLHEFVHYIQNTLRKEKSGDYELPADWSDKDKYMKRPWEQQAHAIAYLEQLKQELNIKKPEALLSQLRKLGVLHKEDLHALKKSDYKSWKAIMKQAIMATVADLKDGKKLPWQTKPS